jgi:hypothetical protein
VIDEKLRKERERRRCGIEEEEENLIRDDRNDMMPDGIISFRPSKHGK